MSKPSLSIILPVHNAEERLATSVAAILDVLPELTSRFEVLIVDDGSLDDTIDVAHELSRCYPQVAVVRHPLRMGLSEAMQTGLENTDGEVVFVGDDQHGLDPDDLRRLWHLRHDDELVLAHQSGEAAPARATWAEKLLTWRPQPQAHAERRTGSGVQMIRRHALQEQQRIAQEQIDRVSQRLDRAVAADRSHNALRRPTYLDRVKRFALGE